MWGLTVQAQGSHIMLVLHPDCVRGRGVDLYLQYDYEFVRRQHVMCVGRCDNEVLHCHLLTGQGGGLAPSVQACKCLLARFIVQ